MFWEIELSCSNKKKLLIYQEMETLKKFLTFSEKKAFLTFFYIFIYIFIDVFFYIYIFSYIRIL